MTVDPNSWANIWGPDVALVLFVIAAAIVVIWRMFMYQEQKRSSMGERLDKAHRQIADRQQAEIDRLSTTLDESRKDWKATMIKQVELAQSHAECERRYSQLIKATSSNGG